MGAAKLRAPGGYSINTRLPPFLVMDQYRLLTFLVMALL
jgi:hypothetical protein